MKAISRVTFITVLCISLSGCAFMLLDWTTPNEGYTLKENIFYGSHKRQALDIYTTTSTPQNITILFFYGGSWQGGKKQDYRFVAQALTSVGYNVVIPDYRVYPEALFPDFMDDTAKALSWTVQNSTQPIVLIGHSAGAHIAALLAMDKQYSQRYNVDNSSIGGFIGLSGPYDFLPLKSRTLKKIFNAADDIQDTQPINYVDSHAPKTLLIHGGDNNIVLPRNSRRLAEKLRENKVKVIERYYPDTGHALTVGALAKSFRKQAPTLRDIDNFLSSLN